MTPTSPQPATAADPGGEIYVIGETSSDRIFSNDIVEVAQATIAKGEARPSHCISGDALIYCVRGSVTVHVAQRDEELRAGQFMALGPGVEHAVTGREEAVLLFVNTVGEGIHRRTKSEAMTETSEDSFPASDPPGWTPGAAT